MENQIIPETIRASSISYPVKQVALSIALVGLAWGVGAFYHIPFNSTGLPVACIAVVSLLLHFVVYRSVDAQISLVATVSRFLIGFFLKLLISCALVLAARAAQLNLGWFVCCYFFSYFTLLAFEISVTFNKLRNN